MRLNEGEKIHDGIWFLNFVEANDYSISFQTKPAAKNVKAKLLINGRVVQTKSFSNEQTMSFDKMKIDAEKTEFRVMRKADNKKTIP